MHAGIGLRHRLPAALCFAFALSLCEVTIAHNAVAVTNSPVVINEVSCAGTANDWIELYNPSATVKADISGLILTDSVDKVAFTDHVYVFPKNTKILPHKYLKVMRGTSGNKFRFNVSCGGNSVTFGNRVGTLVRVLDSVAIPPIADNFTWSRLPGTPYGWGAGTATPVAVNRAAASSAQVDKSAWVFDPLLIKRIDLTLPGDTISNFSAGNPEDAYMPASFSITAKNAQGNVVKSVSTMPITIRLKKGYGSYRSFGSLESPGKSSFKIKFNGAVADPRLSGLKKLTLNNMVQDFPLMNEWASYKLFRAMGIFAPRVGFSTVYINGTYWGFYLTLEPYDDVSLAWRYPRTQHLYEGLWTDRPPDITEGRTYRAYEVDEGDIEDRNDLQALEDVVSDLPMSSSQVREVLDVKQIATFMAIENFINHWDGYTSMREWTPNNYYFHSTATGVFELLPWGTDQTFSGPTGDFLNANGILFKRCYADEWCRSLYLEAIARVATKAQELDLATQSAVIVTVQKSGIDADAAVGRGPTFDQVIGATNGLRDYVTQARAEAAVFLGSRVDGQIRLKATRALPKKSVLKSADLWAYSDVPGTFTYSPKLGTTLPSGQVTVTVKFTPLDKVKYPVRTKAVVIRVAR